MHGILHELENPVDEISVYAITLVSLISVVALQKCVFYDTMAVQYCDY